MTVFLVGRTSESYFQRVPQGTLERFWPRLLLILYKNDLFTGLRFSVKLFLGGSVVYGSIKSHDDYLLLKNDLHALERWCKMWQTNFELKKCYNLMISLTTNNCLVSSSPDYQCTSRSKDMLEKPVRLTREWTKRSLLAFLMKFKNTLDPVEAQHHLNSRHIVASVNAFC